MVLNRSPSWRQGSSRSIRRRISANRLREMATSASWNVTYRPCRTTLAPVLTAVAAQARSVVSDQCSTDQCSTDQCSTASDKANVSRKSPML